MKTKLLRKLRKKAYSRVWIYFVVDEDGGQWYVCTDYDFHRHKECYYRITEANARAETIVKNIFLEVVEEYKNLHGRGMQNFYPW